MDTKLRRRSFLQGLLAISASGVVGTLSISTIKHTARRTLGIPVGYVFFIRQGDKTVAAITGDEGITVMDGLELPKAKFPLLYKFFEEHWKQAQGSTNTTFRLPDLRGQFLRNNQDVQAPRISSDERA